MKPMNSLPNKRKVAQKCSCVSRQQGVTLIELLVALVIGLLGTIVIFTVYQNAEGYKRTTVSAGDAQSNGAIALFSLERYIRTAGSSLTSTNEAQTGTPTPPRPNLLLGCQLIGLPAAGIVTGPNGETLIPIAPVRIIDGSRLAGGVASTSDVIVIMAGNADIATNPTTAGVVPPSTTVINNVGNTYGWRVASSNPDRLADIALFVANTAGGSGAPLISPVNCSARRIASMTTANGPGIMNLAAPTPAVTYTPSTNIHNLGPTPYFLSIRVDPATQQLLEDDFTLMLTNGAAAPVTRVLADGIINIQAQYGIDNNQDDTIDLWVEPIGNIWGNVVGINAPRQLPLAGAEPAAINQIKAIRLAILARSVHYEPPNRNTGVCDATPTPTLPAPGGIWPLLPRVPLVGAPVVAGAPIQPQGADILPAIIASTPANAANANYQCFRYRTFETVIPVLNMLRSPL
jgi:type IV pilus assembly protein PilW